MGWSMLRGSFARALSAVVVALAFSVCVKPPVRRSSPDEASAPSPNETRPEADPGRRDTVEGEEEVAADIPTSNVFGSLDIRKVPAALQGTARSTVAIVSKERLAVGADGQLHVVTTPLRKHVSSICSRCGKKAEFSPRLTKLVTNLDSLHRGVKCGGVALGARVVAMTRHCFTQIGASPRRTFIVVEFVGGSESSAAVVSVKTAYEPDRPILKPEHDLVLLVPADPLDEDYVVPHEKVVKSLRRRRFALAFGYPLGVSRVLSGANKHTRIAQCPDGTVRATLDSFESSSGASVFVSSKSLATSDWRLFGLIRNALADTSEVVCVGSGNKRCDIGLPQSTKVCEASVRVTPLAFALEAARQLQHGNEPSGWRPIVVEP